MIELLVVIAIIAILASLLAPALSRAKSQSYSSQCMNNLRQISLATRLYGDENSDYLPSENVAYLDYAGPGWLYNGVGENNYPDGMTTGLLWPFIENTNIYFCPLDRNPRLMMDPTASDPSTAPWITRWMMCSSYCINGFVNGGSTTMYRSLKWTDFRADGVCYWENNELGDWTSWNDGCNFPYNGQTRRHSSGGNVICFDSHVEWMSDFVFNQQTNSFPGRLNCNPLTTNGTYSWMVVTQ